MKPLAWLILPFWLAAATAPADRDPVPIVRGDDPGQFDLVGIGPDSIAILGDEVRLTGKPLGYFATKQDYGNYALSFEWKYDRPEGLKSDADFRGNGGLLIQIARPHKVWPRCLQVQLAQADPGSIFAMGEGRFEGQVDSAAQKVATRPVGQWNRSEVTSRAGAIVSVLNGTEVARGQGDEAARGAIGWQSEGKPIRFRAIRIRSLP